MRFVRALALVFAVTLVVACKVRIVVPEGGDVSSQSGAFNCKAGETCTIDVVDIFFEETFVATPAQGYRFHAWKKWPGKKNGFCGGRTIPCELSTAGFDASPALMSILEGDDIFYLQPIFKKTATTGSCTPAATSYNLALSGGDTAKVGTSLATGDLAFGREDLAGPIESLIIVDKCSTISPAPAAFPPGDPRNTASFNTADPDNSFVMVVSDATVSMAIVKNAVSYRYACATGVNVFVDCGGLDFNVATKTLKMTKVKVENTDTGSLLTINGTIVWNN